MNSGYWSHMSSTDEVFEQEMLQKYNLALANLKQAYMDTRKNPDSEKERRDIEKTYILSKIEADKTNLKEQIEAESKREGFEKRFLNNPEFGYYGSEHVETNMKRLTDTLEMNHKWVTQELTHEYKQSLRGIDEGIDPARNIEYEGKKKIEEDEEIRVCINNKLFCIQKDLEYEEQARKEAETNQCSRNNFPGDWACGHRYGP